jgi:hypothetical protein
MKDILGAVENVAEKKQCMEKMGYSVVYIMAIREVFRVV